MGHVGTHLRRKIKPADECLVQAFTAALGDHARGRFRRHLRATLRFTDRDRRYQVREQERDVLGSGPDGESGEILRNHKAEKKLHEYASRTCRVLTVPSHRDRTLMGPGTYPGVDGLNPYLLASLVGQYTEPGDMVWEITFAATPIGAYVCPVLGRNAATVIPPDPTNEGDTEAPLVTEWLRASRQGEEGPATRHGTSAPSLIVVHLPLPLDLWSAMCHAAAGDLDFVGGAHSCPPALYPEFADNRQGYNVAVISRIAGIARFMKWISNHNPKSARPAVIAVSTPAWHGWPQLVHDACDDAELDWSFVASLRVYENNPPGDGTRVSPTPDRGGPRHPGDHSPLPPRVVSIWRTT